MQIKCFRSKKQINFRIQNVLCVLLALLISVGLLGASLWAVRPDVQCEVVLLGDSVLANVAVYEGEKIDEYIAEKTGKTVFNGAFGGSSMARRETETLALCNSGWCMASLARAIETNEWGSIKAAMSYADYYKENNRQVLEGYKERLSVLSTINFSEVRVLMIEHGTNDYNSGVPLDNEEDLYDVDTFGGALRTTLRIITKKFPDLRVVIVTPAYSEIITTERLSSDEKDWGGGLLYRYVEKELEIAEQFGVDVIDMYHDSGINGENVMDYTVDGLHLNEAGIKLWGDALSEYLKGYEYEDN